MKEPVFLTRAMDIKTTCMKETWSNRCPNVRACTKIGGHERNKTWWKIKASFWCPFKMGHPQNLSIYICLPSAFLRWAFKLSELLLFLLPIGFFRRTLRLYLKDNPEGGFIVVGGRRHSGIRAEPDADGILIWIICKWLQKIHITICLSPLRKSCLSHDSSILAMRLTRLSPFGCALMV